MRILILFILSSMCCTVVLATMKDRRVIFVKITVKGLDLLAKLDKLVLTLHKDQLGHLSRRELSELNRLLPKSRYPTG